MSDKPLSPTAKQEALDRAVKEIRAKYGDKATDSAFNILAHRSSMSVIPLCRPALWFRLKKRNAQWLLLPLLLH